MCNIKYPVKPDPYGSYIFDADQNMICEVRGWGMIQKMENTDEIMMERAEFIASAINDKLKNK